MKKELLDAVKTAKSIHEGDYSSLRGKSFLICDNMKKKRRSKHVKKSKYTLNQLGTKVDQLGITVDKLTLTVDKLTLTVDKLAEEMRAGFKQVNSRIDNIEKRLDYNNLKRLPK